MRLWQLADLKRADLARFVLGLFTFFSTWALILVAAWPVTRRHLNLPIIVAFAALGGGFFAHVWPQKFCGVPRRKDLCIDHPTDMWIIDVLWHILPLVLVAGAAVRNPRDWVHPFVGGATLNTVLLFVVYIVLMDPALKYGLVSP